MIITSCISPTKNEVSQEIVRGVPDSLALSDFRITIEKGDNWIYKRTLAMGADTLHAYAFWETGIDTTVENESGLILNGVEYQKNMHGVIDTIYRKEIIFQGEDELRVLDFINKDDNYELIGDPVRSAGSFTHMNLDEKRNWIISQKRNNSRSYDTETFSDETYAFSYPLSEGSTWKFRERYAVNGYWEVEYTCMGFDTVQNSGLKKTVEIKSELVYVHDMSYSKWYTENGVELIYADLDSVAIVDEYGDVLDTVKADEWYRRISLEDVEPTFFK